MKRKTLTAVGFLTAFVLWTLAVKTVDVQTIGPCASAVGFAAVNGWFHSLTGVHMTLYTITDWLGLVPVAFGFGFNIGDEAKEKIEELISVDDGKENLEGDLVNAEEPYLTLIDTLTFSKVTQGFVDAMSYVLDKMIDCPFEVDKPHSILRMPDGAYRIFVYNDADLKYRRAFIKAKKGEFYNVVIISKFPILPPRYMDTSKNELVYLYSEEVKVKKGFEVKLQPAGVTIVDVYMK